MCISYAMNGTIPETGIALQTVLVWCLHLYSTASSLRTPQRPTHPLWPVRDSNRMATATILAASGLKQIPHVSRTQDKNRITYSTSSVPAAKHVIASARLPRVDRAGKVWASFDYLVSEPIDVKYDIVMTWYVMMNFVNLRLIYFDNVSVYSYIKSPIHRRCLLFDICLHRVEWTMCGVLVPNWFKMCKIFMLTYVPRVTNLEHLSLSIPVCWHNGEYPPIRRCVCLGSSLHQLAVVLSNMIVFMFRCGITTFLQRIVFYYYRPYSFADPALVFFLFCVQLHR